MYNFSDCGLYVAAYADFISKGNLVPTFDLEFTRIKYASLLWNYGMKKFEANVTNNNEAPERRVKIHRDVDMSDMISID